MRGTLCLNVTTVMMSHEFSLVYRDGEPDTLRLLSSFALFLLLVFYF